jgi:predicted NUDIX family phosphoesterase
MPLMVREILVVKREDLFDNTPFTGFVSIEEKDFLAKILSKFEYRERSDELEKNCGFKQPIPYVWIVNPESKKVFAYQRASHKGYSEKRLRGKWSCGVGGHVDKSTEEFSENPIEDAMMREMQEEVVMSTYPDPKVIGFINLEENDVDKVHFGIVAIAETTDFVEKGDSETAQCKFYSVQELEELFVNPENEVENWTKVSWPLVKDYLSNL